MKIRVVDVIDEDFVNYKRAAMTVGFPYCSFKCGRHACQNSPLADAPVVEVDAAELVDRYIKNPITAAVIFQGLEPFDSPEMPDLVREFRKRTADAIVIYTGYTRDEVAETVERLRAFPNIIVKYGRYVPGQEPHLDDVLGIYLASDNQYAAQES